MAAPRPVGAYPLARKVGSLLFLSGVGPRIPGSDPQDSGVPGLEQDHNGNFREFDFSAQVHGVFANVKSILEQYHCQWEDLVDVQVFLVNMERDFLTFNQIYKDYFEQMDPQPCRTTVAVTALPTPIAIELKCVAQIPGKEPQP